MNRMVRAFMALLGSVVAIVIWATPVWIAGMVYPSRKIVAFGSRWFGRFVLFFSGAKIRIEGLERASGDAARFYVGNHESALDIPVLLVALRGQVRFLAKESLFRIPIIGWAMKRSEFIPVDRSSARRAKETIEAMIDRFRERPISLVIFPEGTRSTNGALLPFRKGSMKICSRAALPVVPFAIEGSGRVAPANRFYVKPGVITLRFAETIPAAEVAAMSAEELHDRVRAAVERHLKGVESDHASGKVRGALREPERP